MSFSGCELLLEDGFFLLQEDDGELLLEDCAQRSDAIDFVWGGVWIRFDDSVRYPNQH